MPRRDFAEPGLLPRILGLLGDVFPGFTESERIARMRGLRWEACSTPFVVEDDGDVVAHVGVLDLPLVLGGSEVLAGGVHAVATHARCRGRGLMRRLMEEALAHCDVHYATLVLTTDQPALYERFGFRTVPEHRFVCDAPGPAGRDAGRPLDLARGEDVALLHDRLRTRAPVSPTLGVVRELPVFLFDTARASLTDFPDLGAVVWSTRDGATLRLHDVVAREVPPLREILLRVASPVARVECYFVPDLLGADFRAEPWLLDGEEHLMARGPFVAEAVPVILPRSARC